METHPLKIKEKVVCIFLGNQERSEEGHPSVSSQRDVFKSLLKEENFKTFAEACYRFSPKVAIRPGEAVFLDISGCEGLYSKPGLIARINQLGQRWILASEKSRSLSFCSFEAGKTRESKQKETTEKYFPIDKTKKQTVSLPIVFAEDVPSSLAFSRYPNCKRKEELPLEVLFDFLYPFGSEGENQETFRKNWVRTTDGIRVFKKLGLKNLGDFLELPRQSLASRFGKKFIALHAAASGDSVWAWQNLLLSEKISEKRNLEEEESFQLDSIFFILLGLIDRAMARLRAASQRASCVLVEFELKRLHFLDGVSLKRRWITELPVSQGSTLGLIRILREKLDHDLQREPLVSTVETLIFEIIQTVPGRSSQLHFFSKKEEDQERWSALVGRLVSRLGESSVFTAVSVDLYLPEKAWMRSLEQESVGLPEMELHPLRPLRLLKIPEQLQYQHGVLTALNGLSWTVFRWIGPERIEGEWWKKAGETIGGFYRDYYQVVTHQGCLLWVFLDRSKTKQTKESQPQSTSHLTSVAPVRTVVEVKKESYLYLHGYFD